MTEDLPGLEMPPTPEGENEGLSARLLGCLERQEKKLVSLLIVSDVFFNLYYTPEDDDYLFGYIGLLSLFTLEWSKKVYDDQMHYIRTNWGASTTIFQQNL